MAKKLSQVDVAKLLSDPSAENRAAAARNVGLQFAELPLTDAERALMEEIFRIMVKDVEVEVRKALSQTLKENPEVPHEVALSLANDVAEVALPIIQFSEVLSDDDLISIISGKDAEHQKAVARREVVSEKVADALVETNNEDVVATLVSNDGAQLSEAIMSRVLDTYGTNPKINEPMALRRELPLTVAERLVSFVSEKFKDHLVTHHAMSPDTAMDLFLSAREKATIGLLQPDTNLRDVQELVDQLHRNKRLTPTLILRALCMGDTTFFETALAKMADIPVANAYKLIYDPGQRGLEALFQKCNLPKQMLPVCRASLTVVDEMRINGTDDRDRFRQVMIERVLTQFEDNFDPENLDYLIAKLGGRLVAA